MSRRLERAFALADLCWAKAKSVEPEFVEMYIEYALECLERTPYVKGDTFRSYCLDRGLRLPKSLHPNTWVSGVGFLKKTGWLEEVAKVEPTEGHNHMNTVTLWRSTVYIGVNYA